MVALTLQCTTVDPTTSTVYALAQAQHALDKQLYYILIKSNPSPTDLITMTWSYISVASNKLIPPFSDDTSADMTCVINPESKVFTAVVFNAWKPVGYEYHPPSALSSGFTKGMWMIHKDDTSFSEGNGSSSSNQILFYSTRPGYKMPYLVYVVAGFQSRSLSHQNWDNAWTIAYGDSKIYIHAGSFNGTLLYSYNLPDVEYRDESPRSSLANMTTGCLQPHSAIHGTSGKFYYLACKQPTSATVGNQVLILNNNSLPTLPQLKTLLTVQGSLSSSSSPPLADARSFIPITGPETDPKPRFAFIQSKTGQMYGLKLDQLEGSVVVLTGPVGVNVVHEKLEFLENGQPFVDEQENNNGEGGTSNVGLIVGIVVTVMVLVFGGLGPLYWTRKRRAAGKGEQGKQSQQNEDSAYAQGEQKHPESEPQQQQQQQEQQNVQGGAKVESDENYLVRPIVLPSISAEGGGYYPTATSQAGYPVTGAPVTTTQPFLVPNQQHQQFQPYTQPQPHHQYHQQQQQQVIDNFQPQPQIRMQGSQFSSHPRPSFVTTAGDGTEGGAVATEEEPFNPIWEPKPFVPPSRPLPTTSTTTTTTTATTTTPTAENGETRLQAP